MTHTFGCPLVTEVCYLQDMSGTELLIGASYVGIYICATNDQPSVYFRCIFLTTIYDSLLAKYKLLCYSVIC